jgi:NAD(P)-dependent dehydrogenase (short-subunit alcohol dehydrogenase family)
MTKTVLVTGASAGIGKATAIHLAQSGYNVYGAARRTEKMQDLKAYGIKPIALDVTKDESVTACVKQIFKEAGSIDILVIMRASVRMVPCFGQNSIRKNSDIHFSYNIPLTQFAKLTGRSLSTFKQDFVKIFNTTPEK